MGNAAAREASRRKPATRGSASRLIIVKFLSSFHLVTGNRNSVGKPVLHKLYSTAPAARIKHLPNTSHPILIWRQAMLRHLFLGVCFAVTLALAQSTAVAQEKPAAEAVFRKLTDEDRADKSGQRIVMGEYTLAPIAVKQLCEVHTLELTLLSIQHFDWKTPRWDKQNAELTIRQQMDRYVQTAADFYDGRGKRQSGVVGKRQEKYTDTELGDQQLSHALWSVVMAAMWDVPLEDGQEQRLNSVLQKRVQMVKVQQEGK
jgi:hypothetical protein